MNLKLEGYIHQTRIPTYSIKVPTIFIVVNDYQMEAGNLGGTSTIQHSKLNFTRSRFGNLHPLYGIRPWKMQNAQQFTGLVLSRRSSDAFIVSCGPSSEIESATNLEDELEGKGFAEPASQTVPSSFEVESLILEICDTAAIAEFELKFGGFRLYLTRDLAGKSKPSPPPSSPTVSTNVTVQTPDSNGSVTTHALAISKPTGETRTLLEKATDEGLVILNSPRVGFFRRSRTIKGKRAPPPCKENQIVKEGQVLCYIEQLGGEIPIESDVSGEVVKILRKDGEPVGYGDALLEILPSFPGIKKLQ
ncbi:hypothetical protein IFM89_006779 [Coptis chinensis]|uniref:Lipoyl-binding domain-containing protein n=1 Tax=Coptis chinensis TaxID=261450 RepID=A0A835I677_9MAGN|nr:hypothetical protein IFM89_006779 [Coptis chinensis]